MSTPTPQTCSSPGTHRVLIELIQQLALPDAPQILDIPSGQGALCRHLRSVGLTPVAADLVEDLRVPDVPFVAANMEERLPFSSCSFDVVICSDGLEHITRQLDFLAECHRVIRSGGSLLISTPNISALRSRWRYLLTGFHNKGKTPLREDTRRPQDHVGLLSYAELRHLLHVSGFRIDAIRTNRVKAISWLYLPLVPFAYLVSRVVFAREERDSRQREVNAQILRQMFSVPVLFGEALVIRAVRR